MATTPTTTPTPEVKKEPQHGRERQPQRPKAVVNASTTSLPPQPPAQSPRPVFNQLSAPTHSYQGYRYSCVLCNECHPLFMCHRFNAMNIAQRTEHMKNHHLCFNCLAPGHKTNDCRSLARCKTCQEKHHTMVHQDRTNQPSLQSSSSTPPQTATINVLCASSSPATTNTLTMTSQVILTGPGGKTYRARALLDSGSSITLISSQAVQALSLPTTHAKVTFTGALDEPLKSTKSLVHVSLSSLQANQQALTISTAVVSKVACNQPLKDASCMRNLPYLQNLPLADPEFHLPGRVDLLLGGDVVSQIMLPEIKWGSFNMPVAFNTTLGWVIMGPYPSLPPNIESTILTKPTEPQLSSAQETEQPGHHSSTPTLMEESSECHIKLTHSCLDSICRYQVAPQKTTDPPPVEENPARDMLQLQESEQFTSARTCTAVQIQSVAAQKSAPPSEPNHPSAFPMASVYLPSLVATRPLVARTDEPEGACKPVTKLRPASLAGCFNRVVTFHV